MYGLTPQWMSLLFSVWAFSSMNRLSPQCMGLLLNEWAYSSMYKLAPQWMGLVLNVWTCSFIVKMKHQIKFRHTLLATAISLNNRKKLGTLLKRHRYIQLLFPKKCFWNYELLAPRHEGRVIFQCVPRPGTIQIFRNFGGEHLFFLIDQCFQSDFSRLKWKCCAVFLQ